MDDSSQATTAAEAAGCVRETAIERGRWDRIRTDWISPAVTLAGIADKHDVSAEDILHHAKKSKWPPRPEGIDALILIRRLLGVLERQIEHLKEMTMTASGEKEAAVLGRLTQNLGKLIDLQKDAARGPEQETETAEMLDLRNKLAERINALTKR
jgi:hypothetical protein